MEADFSSLQRAVTVVLNLSLALLVGASAALLWLRTAPSPWAAALRSRLRALLLGATAGAMLAYGGILWVEAASMAEVPLLDALPAVRSVLTATHWGLAWTIGAAALLAAGALALVSPHSQANRALIAARLLAIGVLLYSRSMVSHAGAGGDFSWAVAVDWVHLLLVSLWVGEVIVAGLIVLRALPGDLPRDLPAGRADCARYVEALSHSATLALAGIFLTGALGAWRVLGSPQDLLGNTYGSALLVKVALVLCAAALGGFNRFRVMPALLGSLRQPRGPGPDIGRRFARILQLEALLLLAAILAAAVLTSSPPPMAS